MIVNNSDIFEVMQEAQSALEKIQEHKSRQKDPLAEIRENIQKFDAGRHYFEPYDQLVWESKARVDMLFFQQLLTKLEESQTNNVQALLGSYMKTVRQIYEFVNIRPEFFGKGINEEILESSSEECSEKVSNVIYEFLDRHFYSLSKEKRVKAYIEESREYGKKLITDGVNAEDALAVSAKSVIMEKFVKKVSFPFSAWSRINYLCESEDYGKVFDQAELIQIVEDFNKKAASLSRIVAVLI